MRYSKFTDEDGRLAPASAGGLCIDAQNIKEVTNAISKKNRPVLRAATTFGS